MAKPKLKKVEAPKLLKLDLGCGPHPREGFTGVDCRDFGQEYVSNLKVTPWKLAPKGGEGAVAIDLEDESVEEVHCSHFLEHLTGAERVDFFNELYRVLVKGGKASIVVPHWSSERAYGDPTHQWPPVVGMSFFYLDKKWREGNAPHTGFTCDFDFVGGNSLSQQWVSRNQETQAFAQTHYINVAQDMWVTITKK